MSLLDRAVVRLLPAVPRPLVQRLSSRYIAGPRLADAVHAVRRLNGRGRMATVDVLGEEIQREEDARALCAEYVDALAAIERERLDSTVSVKLTALGLKLDRGLCRELLERVVRDAAARGNFVRIDMEDSSTTDDALELYRELRGTGLDNVGVVLQSRLRRTLDDVRALADLRPNVRLCKGIYLEPPAIAFQDPDEIRAAFGRALAELLDAGCYAAVATHDEWLLQESRRLVRARGLDREAYEFQVLLGVRADAAERLVREGERLRVYVPYGERWYEYSLRRLQENPALAGVVAAETLGGLLRGGR